MPDNTVLNNWSGGDTIRDVAKTVNSSAKTEVVLLDIGGNADASSEVALAYTTKSVQGAYPIPRQRTPDGGRTYVSITGTSLGFSGPTSLMSGTVNVGGTTSSTAIYTVPAGNTLRIQALLASMYQGQTSVPSVATVALVAAASVATTSPVLVLLDVPVTERTFGNATLEVEGSCVGSMTFDGLEVAANQQIALAVTGPSPASESVKMSIALLGYLY